MIVMILERVPPSLRGALTRWLLEARPHVYVGTVSARIGNRLWDRAVKHCKDGSAIQIISARTEQGFIIRTHGNPSYQPRDFEGITLIARPCRGSSGTTVATSSGGEAQEHKI